MSANLSGGSRQYQTLRSGAVRRWYRRRGTKRQFASRGTMQLENCMRRAVPRTGGEFGCFGHRQRCGSAAGGRRERGGRPIRSLCRIWEMRRRNARLSKRFQAARRLIRDRRRRAGGEAADGQRGARPLGTGLGQRRVAWAGRGLIKFPISSAPLRAPTASAPDTQALCLEAARQH
jgi:hypothetical protein